MSNLFADISSNNGGFNAGAYASGGVHPQAIMIKATEGTGYVNPYYGGWAHDAHRHGLAVFHYHFARPELGDPFGQAKHFWEVAHPHFRRPGDYVIADVETGVPREGALWLKEFDQRLESISDTHPWCYTFLSYFLTGGLRVRSGNMHIAAWGSSRPGNFRWRLPGGLTLAAWQYSDGVYGPEPHGFAGIPGRCDGSILNPSIVRTLRRHKK